jgi:alcohol dehydrogenase class IV
VIPGPPTTEILNLKDTETSVVAIGGGAVIDTAKIISSQPIICYPTTAAGAACTSHSVCWDGNKKKSIKGLMPKEVHVVEEFVKDLPACIKEETTYDALSHCLDSMWSKRKTRLSMMYVEEALEILEGSYSNCELVEAGNIAGKAIEICPTTILHALSYPLTAHYGISHGRALGFLLPGVCKFMNFDLEKYNRYQPISIPDINCDFVAKKALQYNKIYDILKEVNCDVLVGVLNFSKEYKR